MRGLIKEAGRRMLPLERQVLLMSSAEGLTYEEIGARLGYPAKPVEQILADAIIALERNLNDCSGG